MHKRHGLQGPVDDAFLDSFVFVSPTGTPLAPGVAGWVADEQKHAIASSNLVLWGDLGSNRVFARIADKLPVKWTADGIIAGNNRFATANHVPILIYPNPLNPKNTSC